MKEGKTKIVTPNAPRDLKPFKSADNQQFVVVHKRMVEGLTPEGRRALREILDSMMVLFSKVCSGAPLTVEDLAHSKKLIGDGLGDCK